MLRNSTLFNTSYCYYSYTLTVPCPTKNKIPLHKHLKYLYIQIYFRSRCQLAGASRPLKQTMQERCPVCVGDGLPQAASDSILPQAASDSILPQAAPDCISPLNCHAIVIVLRKIYLAISHLCRTEIFR